MGDGLLPRHFERKEQEEGVEEFFGEDNGASAVNEGVRVHEEDSSIEGEEKHYS